MGRLPGGGDLGEEGGRVGVPQVRDGGGGGEGGVPSRGTGTGRGRGAGGSMHVPPGSELSSFSQAVQFDVPFSSPSCGCWRKNASAVQGHELCVKTAVLALPGLLS